MGTSDMSAAPATNPQQVVLPPGVTVQPGISTSQTNGLGNVVQGTKFTVILANGTTTTVFVPDTALASVAQIQACFDAKINALNAVPVG